MATQRELLLVSEIVKLRDALEAIQPKKARRWIIRIVTHLAAIGLGVLAGHYGIGF